MKKNTTVFDTVGENTRHTSGKVSHLRKTQPTVDVIQRKHDSVSVTASEKQNLIQKYSEHDISVATASCKVPSHVGCVRLTNTDMIFIDTNNNLVKLVSSNFNYKSHFTLQSKPVDVSLIRDNKIGVVTCNQIVVFVVTNDTLRNCFNLQFKVEQELCSFCWYNDKMAVLMKNRNENTKIHIQIRSKEHKIVNDIVRFSDSTRKPVKLDNPSLIRPCKQDFFICEKKQMVVIDNPGKQLRRYNNESLQNVACIVLM